MTIRFDHVPLWFTLYQKKEQHYMSSAISFNNNRFHLCSSAPWAVTLHVLWPKDGIIQLWDCEACRFMAWVNVQCEVWVQSEVRVRAHAESCSAVHSLKHTDNTLPEHNGSTSLTFVFTYDDTQGYIIVLFNLTGSRNHTAIKQMNE